MTERVLFVAWLFRLLVYRHWKEICATVAIVAWLLWLVLAPGPAPPCVLLTTPQEVSLKAMQASRIFTSDPTIIALTGRNLPLMRSGGPACMVCLATEDYPTCMANPKIEDVKNGVLELSYLTAQGKPGGTLFQDQETIDLLCLALEELLS